MIEYYITRWEHLNLIEPFNEELYDPKKRIEAFQKKPEQLLTTVHQHGDTVPDVISDF